jgi:hypothetical protein
MCVDLDLLNLVCIQFGTYILIDILILSCLSLRILWAPWPRTQTPVGRTDRTDGWIGRTDLGATKKGVGSWGLKIHKENRWNRWPGFSLCAHHHLTSTEQ